MTLSIGLPVYNGERYVLEAITALLAQTYRDFELIIMDNASTDRTPEICRRAAESDSRVRYFRNDSNIGPVRNFNRVFGLAKGKYFKWAAHDDTYAPEYLAKCIAVLDHDPGVVLCTSRTRVIGEHGETLREHVPELPYDSAHVRTRFRACLDNFMTYEIFGVIRTDALKKTPLLGSFGHADGVLLGWLALQGRIVVLPEPFYFNRVHPEKSMNYYSNYRDYTVWLDPTKAGKILLPRWRMGYEFFHGIVATDLILRDRLSCMFEMLHWVRVFWKSLAANIAIACYQIVTKPFGHVLRSWRTRTSVVAVIFSLTDILN
jgi:glycosyltransferase involved in cell wall biosynthesis